MLHCNLKMYLVKGIPSLTQLFKETVEKIPTKFLSIYVLVSYIKKTAFRHQTCRLKETKARTMSNGYHSTWSGASVFRLIIPQPLSI